ADDARKDRQDHQHEQQLEDAEAAGARGCFGGHGNGCPWHRSHGFTRPREGLATPVGFEGASVHPSASFKYLHFLWRLPCRYLIASHRSNTGSSIPITIVPTAAAMTNSSAGSASATRMRSRWSSSASSSAAIRTSSPSSRPLS